MGARSQRHKLEIQGLTSQQYSPAQAPTNISLTPSTIAANSAINTVVGALATADEDLVDEFAYSFVSNPGSLFNILGAQVRANVANLSAGAKPVTVQVTDKYGMTFSKALTITVT